MTSSSGSVALAGWQLEDIRLRSVERLLSSEAPRSSSMALHTSGNLFFGEENDLNG
ncbi:hypothetical protein QTI17_34545 [Variovorax sp. J31P179]|uniref:hypothetical protein n=1 Tax=Variovorax sp. J31P179 TaxID=3053508 RepID=UPI0025762D41|nr:hypothetical protein [Variovorax sp. J31P179]MDM0085710.1 hypothetical protein [Variovorax sp. J31P179]